MRKIWTAMTMAVLGSAAVQAQVTTNFYHNYDNEVDGRSLTNCTAQVGSYANVVFDSAGAPKVQSGQFGFTGMALTVMVGDGVNPDPSFDAVFATNTLVDGAVIKYRVSMKGTVNANRLNLQVKNQNGDSIITFWQYVNMNNTGYAGITLNGVNFTPTVSNRWDYTPSTPVDVTLTLRDSDFDLLIAGPNFDFSANGRSYQNYMPGDDVIGTLGFSTVGNNTLDIGIDDLLVTGVAGESVVRTYYFKHDYQNAPIATPLTNAPPQIGSYTNVVFDSSGAPKIQNSILGFGSAVLGVFQGDGANPDPSFDAALSTNVAPGALSALKIRYMVSMQGIANVNGLKLSLRDQDGEELANFWQFVYASGISNAAIRVNDLSGTNDVAWGYAPSTPVAVEVTLSYTGWSLDVAGSNIVANVAYKNYAAGDGLATLAFITQGNNTYKCAIDDLVVYAFEAPAPPPSAVNLAIASLGAGSVEISWTGESWASYALWSTESLTPPAWTNLVNGISGVDGGMAATTTVSGVKSFYRVEAQ